MTHWQITRNNISDGALPQSFKNYNTGENKKQIVRG